MFGPGTLHIRKESSNMFEASEPVQELPFSYHLDCTKCSLHKGASTVGIGGNGEDEPDILVVLDYVTKYDDKAGIAAHPGSSAASALRGICEAVTSMTGLKFRYTTAVRCVPLDSEGEDGQARMRTPSQKEINACSDWLQEEISKCNPKVVVLAGGTALKAVLGKECKVGDMRGNPVWRKDRVYLPTFHPINMLPSKRATMTTPEQYSDMIMEDIAKAASIADGSYVKPEELSWKVCKSKEEAVSVLVSLSAAQHNIPMVALDIETNTYGGTEVDNIFKSGLKILCVGLSWEENVSHVIPLAQDDCHYRDDYEFQRELVHAIWGLKCKFVLQNGIYDFVALHLAYGVSPWHPYHDTILMHHLLWSHLPHSLRELAKVHTPFGGYDDEVKTLVSALPVKERGYHKIPFSAVARKNAHDAAITRNLGVQFLEQVSKDEKLLWVYDNVTIPITYPLMQMSLRGVAISVEDARQAKADNKIMQYKITKMLSSTEEWQNVEEKIEKKLEVNKPLHRAALLFLEDGCGLTPTKISKKTGMPSTDKAVLEDLSEKHPIAFGIKRLRELQTFKEKTLDPIPSWIGYDGRVHTTYKVYGTRTGRLSSAEPNMQNMGRSSLSLIKAQPGYQLIVCDISQAEIRMSGSISNEITLINAFNAGHGPDGKPLDIHASVAQEMFGISYEQAKTDEVVRRIVKGLSFGLIYGMTKHGLSVRIKKTPEEAEELINLYFLKFPRIKKVLFEETKDMLLNDGYIRTIFGRYWHLSAMQKAAFHEIKMEKGMRGFWDNAIPAEALRQAANCRVQSPTSDIVLRGVLKFTEEANALYSVGELHKPWYERDADLYLSNEIHDSAIVEVKDHLVPEVAVLLKHCMENPELPFKLPVPWVADLKYGPNMGSLEKM